MNEITKIDVLPDLDAAMAFLDSYYFERKGILVSIPCEGGPLNRHIFDGDGEETRAWLADQFSERRNCYITVNEVRDDFTGTKPKKSDMTAMSYYHVDIDPEEFPSDRPDTPFDRAKWFAQERERLEGLIGADFPDGLPPATLVIDSGGGFQLLWQLADAIPIPQGADDATFSALESHNRAIAKAFGGDNCHNLDRILRLPGTVNFPNQKKRERGQVAVVARLRHMDLRQTVKPVDFDHLADGDESAKAETWTSNVIQVDFQKREVKGSRLDKAFSQGSKKSKSEKTFEAIALLVEHGYSDDEIIETFGEYPDSAAALHCRSEEHLRSEIRRVRPKIEADYRKRHAGAPPSKTDVSGPLEFNVADFLLNDNVRKLDVMFAEHCQNFFQQEGRVVCVENMGRSWRHRQLKAPHIAQADESRIKLAAMDRASFWKWDGRNEKFSRTKCPDELAKMYLAHASECSLRELVGIIETPTITEQGRIIQQEGYDAESRLLYVPNAEFPPVPANPTRDDARKAVEVLKQPFRRFPYVTPADLSVVLAGVLTATIRRSLEIAPFTAYDAPTSRTGKSKQAQVTSIIATGRRAPAKVWTGREEENEKRVSAALMAGDLIVFFDNVPDGMTVEGEAAICAYLTAPTATPRVLGRSEQPTIHTRAMFLFSGNQLTFGGDLKGRGLMARIDAGVEHPEERSFDFVPEIEARAHRPQLVTAALTIIKAYLDAGAPDLDGVKPFGDFTQWDRMVRRALIWAGCADPLAVRHRMRAVDEKAEQFRRMADLWIAVFGNQPVTVDQLLNAHMQGESPTAEAPAIAAPSIVDAEAEEIQETKNIPHWSEL